MRNIEIIIKGRVQGVGFRYHTKQIAQELSIKGYVRNLYDGSVNIFASGLSDDIDRFIKWCRDGPRMALVESIQIIEMDEKEFNDFSIR